jgi:hypothetical protein
VVAPPFSSLTQRALRMAESNPYLAHWNHSGAKKADAPVSVAAPGGRDPLYGFIPRKVSSEQVTKALVRAPSSRPCLRLTRVRHRKAT